MASSSASSSASQGPPWVKAASEAMTPNSPAPSPISSWIAAASPCASAPGTTSAALSPARFHALDAEAMTNERAAAGASRDANGMCRRPGYVSGAGISSAMTRTS